MLGELHGCHVIVVIVRLYDIQRQIGDRAVGIGRDDDIFMIYIC